jgi:type II secretory pathway component PulC
VVRILVKLFLIFILLYAGVTIVYGRLEEKLQQDSVAGRTIQAPPPEEKTEILRKPDDYTIIVRRNIFQAVVEKTEEEAPVVEQAPLEPTKLKLSLMGTISGVERDARAIISDDAKRQQDIYQVGDSIQGAMIKEIERGKVVLSVNGKDEVLTLKDREGGGGVYQPSPTDFYQEPPEPQESIEMPESAELEESPETLETPSVPTPTTLNQRRRVVRPRPVRRPPRPGNPVNGIDQP